MQDPVFLTPPEMMVSDQLKSRGIRDPRVLEAMGSIPRHAFVPDPLRPSAYEDHPLPIGFGQTISQPYMVARMTELLELEGQEKILEIGTGSGYQTAILASLARRVVTVERIPGIHRIAGANLEGIPNIRLVLGDGTLGFPEESPYDRILVTAGGPEIPPALLLQLAENGRLVIPVGDRTVQVLKIMTKRGGKLLEQDETRCVFVPLTGEQGWPG